MLTPDDLAFYHENGYFVARGLFTPQEAAEMRRECHELAERLGEQHNMDATWGSAREALPNAKDTKSCTAIMCSSIPPPFSAPDRRPAPDRYGRVRDWQSECPTAPYQDVHQAAGKGSPFPMHQDAPYFPHDRQQHDRGYRPFDDAPIEKGCVRVVPGSHKNASWNTVRRWLAFAVAQYPIESAVPCRGQCGRRAVFLLSDHSRSGINVSSEARTTLLIQMRDPTDPPTIQTHESRGQGMMLRGIDPLALPRGVK